MLDAQTGWLVGIVTSLVIGAVFAWWKGAEVGLGVAVIVSLLFPDWIRQDVLGITFNIRTSVAILAMGSYAVRFPWRIRSPLTPLDFAVAGRVIVRAWSDYYHGEGLIAGLKAYGEWALPYVCGRYALKGNRDPEILGWFVCGVVVLLSIGGIVEVLSSVNPWELVFGNRDGQAYRMATRFGFKRAFVNTEHPIFFGMQLIVLLPWQSYLWCANRSVVLKALVSATIVAGFFGCISSVSRTPVLAFVSVLLLSVSVKYTWARWVACAGGNVLLIALMQNPVELVKQAAEVTGDKVREISLEGDEIPMSSVLVRVWMLKAYWPALRDAGLLGYGSFATRTFPVDVPNLPKDKKARYTFRWVDNAYILMTLRFGLAGLVALSVFFLIAIWQGLRLREDRYWDVMAISISSMYLTTSLLLLTVWLSYDFGYELLWMSGVLSGIRIWDKD